VIDNYLVGVASVGSGGYGCIVVSPTERR